MGMHRSGMSALTGALTALGVEFGDKPVKAETDDHGSATGSEKIRLLNSRLLFDVGRRWSSLGLIEAEDLSPQKHGELFEQAGVIMRDNTARFPMRGFADPRTARMLPFWRQVFESLGLRVAYIISLRDPLSVARSLEAENNLPHLWSQVLWLQHYLASFRHTLGESRLVVGYDLLVSNPEAQIARIAALLGISLDRSPGLKIREYCEALVNPNLRHSSLSAEEKEQQSGVIPHLWEFYEQVLEMAHDRTPQGSPEESDLLAKVEESMRSFSGLLSLTDIVEARRLELQKQAEIASRLREFLGRPRGRALLFSRLLPRWMKRITNDESQSYISDTRGFVSTRRFIKAWLYSLTLASPVKYDQPAEQKEATREFSIIVPIHDAPDVTARCLLSLERYAPNAETILVDDGSELQETRDLIETFGVRNSWKITRNLVPQGHSRACESGAREATRPYLCLLNSDTVVTPWSWSSIRDAFALDSTIGIAGPSTSWAASRQMISIARESRHLWTDGQICSFALRYTRAQAPKAWEDLYPEHAMGFAFFIRRELWEALGGFDPGLPDYGNESDLCVRARLRGYRVVWVKNSYIHHFGRKSYSLLGSREVIKKMEYGKTVMERWRADR